MVSARIHRSICLYLSRERIQWYDPMARLAEAGRVQPGRPGLQAGRLGLQAGHLGAAGRTPTRAERVLHLVGRRPLLTMALLATRTLAVSTTYTYYVLYLLWLYVL